MKVPYIKTDDLNAFKMNLSNKSKEFENEDNDWITRDFGSSFFKNSRMEMPDIVLDQSEEIPYKTDFENVRKIYDGLRNLSDSNAADERIWDALALKNFYPYVKYRWGKNGSIDEAAIRNKYLFGYGKRRSLLRHAIARLWWIGRLTYDEKRKDKYELTRFLCSHPDFLMHVLERSFSSNPRIVREFLQALMDADEKGYKINTDTVGELAKYLNILGGTYVLDVLPENEIYKKIMKRIEDEQGVR